MSSDKILLNLNNLIDLNDASYPSACNQIGIVKGYLNGSQPKDNGPSLFSNLLFSAVGLIGDIEGIPVAPAIAWFLSAVVNKFSASTQPDLYDPYPEIEARYDATYRAIDTELIRIMNDITFKCAPRIIHVNLGMNLGLFIVFKLIFSKKPQL